LFESQPDLVNRLRPSFAFIVLFVALVVARRDRLRELGVSAPWQGLVRGGTVSYRQIALLCGACAIAVAWLSPVRVFVLGTALVMSCIFLSLSLLVGTSGLVNLGQAGLVGTGAFIYIHATVDWGLPFPLAVLIAGLAAVPLGLAIALPALRLPGLFLALATFAVGQLVDGLLFGWVPLSGGPDGLRGRRPGLLETDTRYVLFLVGMLALFLLVTRAVRRSALGRALAAMRDSTIATETLGISAVWPRLAVFSISAFLAGIAGALYAGHLQVASRTYFTTFASILWLVVIVVGGVQSAIGAVVGAFLLTWGPELTRGASGVADLLNPAFGVAAMVHASRPGGIAGDLRALRLRRFVSVRAHNPTQNELRSSFDNGLVPTNE
jgi:ABC-type branched-subunit amino acid transport system permease subunit